MVMPTILYCLYPWRMSSRRLAGIRRYAQEAGWHVQVLEWGRTDFPIRDALRFWRPIGCIVEGGYVESCRVTLSDFGTVPVVFCDVNEKHLNGPHASVSHDSAESVELAFQEFRRRGLTDIGFVGTFRAKDWSERRENLLREKTLSVGGRFQVFQPPSQLSDASGVLDALASWIGRLPKPCGIMGANDLIADLVLQACQLGGIAVPDAVSVVGVDDDDLICENSSPTLSSVAPDFEQMGYKAAELLARQMRSRKRGAVHVVCGSCRLVRRSSTFTFVRRDDGVRAAVDLIVRTHGHGLTAASVIAVIGGSRRSAEMRFKTLTGQAIGAAIRTARIELAQQLIRRHGRSLGSIHADCGYASEAALRRAFRLVTGLSPRAWRDTQSVR